MRLTHFRPAVVITVSMRQYAIGSHVAAAMALGCHVLPGCEPGEVSALRPFLWAQAVQNHRLKAPAAQAVLVLELPLLLPVPVSL